MTLGLLITHYIKRRPIHLLGATHKQNNVPKRYKITLQTIAEMTQHIKFGVLWDGLKKQMLLFSLDQR